MPQKPATGGDADPVSLGRPTQKLEAQLTMFDRHHRGRALRLVPAAVLGLTLSAAPVSAQLVRPPEGAANPAGPNRANWALAEKFSGQSLRGMTYSTSINARWVGETDSLFYSWRNSRGLTHYLVNAVTRQKQPLFDHTRLAAQLSTLHRKAYDPNDLPFTSVNFTKDHKNIRFVVDSTRYNWNLATATLTRLGLYRGAQDSAMTADEEVQEGGGGRGGGRGGGGRGGRGQGGGGGAAPDPRNFSPDSTAFVFGRNNNLFFVEVGRPDTMQITTDGAPRYSFVGGGGRGGRGNQQDTTQQDDDDNQQGGRGRGRGNDDRVRPNVQWSPDSKAFYLTRTDARGTPENSRQLYLVNVLSEPRPTLSAYNYTMPGEDSLSQQELWTYYRGEPSAKKVPLDKWPDQRLVQTNWARQNGTKVHVARRDRLQRNVDYLEVDLPSGNVRTMITESLEVGNIERQTESPVYLPNGDFIWWSERTGWGHYYLYDKDGNLKRALTSGDWRADQITEIDSVRNVVWISGIGREPGENVYHRHTYRVALDGSSFTLLNPGDFSHSTDLSTNRKWVVNTASRTDSAPQITLRDATTGRHVMDLESTDMSRLFEAGWRYPTPFVTKAADGVTDIYGRLIRPFDFDSTKKYPIIAYVYPGPQQEGTNHTFSTGGTQMQLAQLGFIVIHIGNRGGTPQRSNAYQSYSYFNLRDYALADKKTGIEQLAARYPWIDIDRVGIYGHSGGGFLTGAALLVPPYNEFFKVGVSSAGNHDNNIYNQNWSEQYHGLQWVAAADTACLTARAKGQECATGTGRGRGAGVAQGGRGGGRGGGGRGAGRGGNGRGAANGEEAAASDSVFWIYVPRNPDVAMNLKGKLLLVHGDMDNNVHPGNTIRLVDALIKANKRFDMMIMPGQPHSFGPMQPYFNRMMMEYFAEHLLGDYQRNSADMNSR